MVGYFLIICAFLIKLGAFPYHFWVVSVYTNLSNMAHLLMITVINVGFLLSFLQLLNHILKSLFNYEMAFFTTLLVASALGSTLFGGLLLLSQTTVKGFLASNSVLNVGFMLLNYAAFLNLSIPGSQLQLI